MSQSWEANTQAGALPDANLLRTGRGTITLLLPLSLMFIYLIGKRIHSPTTGLIAALLVGSHALTLLHARRAMAEGPLLFGTTLAVWSLLQARKRPWLTGLGIALAFNAKQSALAILPVGLLAVCWLPANTDRRIRKMAVNLAQFMGVFAVVTIALSPLLWSNPWRAAQASIQARQELINQQIEDTKRIAPEKYLETPTQRLTVLIANLYVGPATYGLVGNLAPIRDDVDAYIAIPGHNLLRGLWGGGILLVLTLFGLYLAGRDSWQGSQNQRRELTLLLLATTLQGAALIIAVPLPWPRYSIPMIAFECLWIAYGVTRVLARKSPAGGQ
ncbi:MAG: phospholipid carrier-dependent glycosyltransferase [Chloroflexota bacterium]